MRTVDQIVDQFLVSKGLLAQEGAKRDLADELAIDIEFDGPGWGSAMVKHGSGRIPITAFLDSFVARNPDRITARGDVPSPATALPETTSTMTDRAMMKIAAERSQDGRKAQAAEIAAAGNPWMLKRLNITAQMTITNLDPDLAKRLKIEAGVTR